MLDHQLHDLAALLGHQYGWVGVGRDNGKRAGEAVPIFYNKWVSSCRPSASYTDVLALCTPLGWLTKPKPVGRKVFKLGSVRHFWLSDTPDVPGSVGWDAVCHNAA